MLFCFHFFSFFFRFAISTRPDLDNANGLTAVSNILITSTCSGSTWDTSNIVFCPENTWAYGFRITTSKTIDLNGVLNIGLDCRDQTYASSSAQMVEYVNMGYNGNLALENTAYALCDGDSGRDFIRKANIRMWCPDSNAAHPTGICEFKMHCSYNNDIATTMVTNQSSANWTDWSKCNAGFVVCGYEIRYLNSYQSGSFYGATDLTLQCCRICDVQQGFYLTNAKLCAFCDANCKECFGSSTNCTKCFDGYALTSANTCTIAATANIPVFDFFSGYSLDSTWSTNSKFSLSNTCSNYYFVGGYNGLDSTHFLQKTITALGSHSWVRIRFHFFKIGIWGDNGFGLVDINSARALEMTWATLESPIYYKDDCGWGNYLYNSQQANILLESSVSSLTVKISVNFTGSGWWAIRGFAVTIYDCDTNCLNCSGYLSANCSSCASGSFLTSWSTCVTTCSSPKYGDPTTNTCVDNCPKNYYMDTSTRVCVTICSDNYYKNMADYTCYSTCPTGFYGNPNTGYCEPSCPTGYYGNKGICLLCDFNCATCSENAKNCSGCSYNWLGSTPNCSNPTCFL